MADVAALIERWREGDERAARALYDAHRDRTYRLAYGLLGNAADAEEAAQDALTYALVNVDRYDASRAAFATWLYTITVSRCRDRLRRKGRYRRRTFSLAEWLHRGKEPQAEDAGPEGAALQREMRGRVWNAVQKLSPPLKEAVILRYWGEHTYREIAEIVGCPLPTAQSRVRLAYDQLRRSLAEGDPGYLAQGGEMR
jgi:RNA polymerase sigma-70 factor (ECF subfamily)